MAQKASFQELLTNSENPVLVDFWAEWCGPCHMVAPVIEQIAREYKGQVTVVKVNIDKQPHIAREYGIQSIPTIMMFRGGKPIMRESGARPYPAMKDLVDRALSGVAS